MRHLAMLSLFSLFAVAAAAVTLASDAFALGLAAFAPPSDHFGLIPGAPRSIRDTRRMGLA